MRASERRQVTAARPPRRSSADASSRPTWHARPPWQAAELGHDGVSWGVSTAVRTGGVEPPQREATGLQPAELADAQRPQEGGRPGSNRFREAHNLGCSPLTPRPPRTGTTGLEPASSRLTSERSPRLSYVPREKAEGGIGSPQPEAETLPSRSVSGASCYPSAPLPARVRAATSSPVGPGGLSRPAAR